MNQPIPRSFFKDGQRARFCTMSGKIVVNSAGGIGFVYDEDGARRIILQPHELLHAENNLELLDRTIDQVMEGDTLQFLSSDGKYIYMYVCARIGGAVYVNDINSAGHKVKATWYELEDLSNWGWTIKQPSNPEVLTDETAKALRTQSIDNAWQPKRGEKYYTADQDGDIDEYVWVGHFDDVAYCTMGNCHKTEEDAALWHKKYAPAFLHVFKK